MHSGFQRFFLAAAVVTGYLLWNSHRTPSPVDLEAVTKFEGLSWDPTLSADGKTLAYSSDRNGPGNLNIWIQNIDSDFGRRLTHDVADDITPALSPDGQFVTYRSYRDGGGIYLDRVRGGAERLVAKFGLNPRFSPLGDIG